jgi:Flp pilus assembly protein TadB
VTSAALLAAALAGAGVLALANGPALHARRRLDASVVSSGSGAAIAGTVSAVGCAWLAGLSPTVIVLMLSSGWSLRWFFGRRALVATRRANRAITQDLPAAADLLAACLTGGAAPSEALDVVAAVSPEPLCDRLRSAAAGMRLGAGPVQAWGAVSRDDPLAPMARAFARSMTTGAPLATTVATMAGELRRDRRFAAEASARRAGVLAVGPLMLCFLPAFLLIGVVPVVVGVASSVLGDLAVSHPHP